MRNCMNGLVLWAIFIASGCGSSERLSVSGTLLKGGEKYVPVEGRTIDVYFYPLVEGAGSASSVGDPEMADYNEADGSFTVPGRDGNGILPGKYRITISETLRRESFDQLKNEKKTGGGKSKKIDRETDFNEATFGPNTSPIVREIKTSTKLVIDMAKPAE